MRTGNLAPWALAIAVSGFCLVQRTTAQARPIDAANSSMTVHVSKAGLFSAFGDNHEVAAPIAEGSVDGAARTVTLVIEAQRMRVVDPGLSPEKRQEVQARMLGPDVLDVARFPRIIFESTAVEQSGPGRLLVRGRLSLHGVTRAVSLAVTLKDGRYVGVSTLKQREFGITPVSVAGGTVKVKDELKIEFDIRTRAPATAAGSK